MTEKREETVADYDLALAIGCQILEHASFNGMMRAIMCDSTLQEDLTARCVELIAKRIQALGLREAHIDRLSEVLRPSPNVFPTPCSYIFPTVEDLRKRYLNAPPNDFARYYAACAFQPVEACSRVKRHPRELVFEYVRMGPEARTKDVLETMEKKGLRPAMAEEFFAFEAHYPWELERCRAIAVLGSVITIDRFGFLGSSEPHAHALYVTQRRLQFVSFANSWSSLNCFLAVPKDA